MADLSLPQLDANLLVSLNILLEERSVSRAAKRMGISQPAMSQTLQRLRDLFEDPLLVRSGREMLPTPFARGLARRLHCLLSDLEALIREKPVFDPGQAKTHFTIAALDYVSSLFLPQLLTLTSEVAPGVNLAIRPLDKESIVQDLESGTADAAIGLFPTDAFNIEYTTLFMERFICLVRSDHPILEGDEPSVEEYVKWPHGLIDPRGDRVGAVDRRLAKQGLERRVAISLPFFLAAGEIIESSDIIFTLPERLGRYLAEQKGLTLFEPPLPLPVFPIRLGWHARLDADPGNIWLRESIYQVVAETALEQT
ncbi:MAG: LysR family transcriptional regulator [Bradymonadaceae bacterium]